MSDMQVQAELRLKDNLSKPAATALDTLGKNARKAGAAADAINTGGGVKALTRDAADAARSVGTVGREARQAHQHLKAAATGGQTLSRTLARARDTARDASRYVSQMGKGLVAAGRAAKDIGGGALAAGYVGKAAMAKPIDYEEQLARTANTAYSDKGAEERIAEMKDINATVVESVRTGGGSREQGLEAYSSMLAGGLDKGTADKLLPTLMRAASASGASPSELAAIMIKGVSQKQFTADEAEAVIDKAIKAGEAGGFELKDMARWLPQIISAGKGMKGMAGFEQHLANLQMVEKVTGSKDQAGNAYFNLLGKMFSQDTAGDFKKQGINITKVMGDAVAKGEDPVTAFVRAVEEGVVGKDKRYKKLKQQLDASKDDNEKRAIMEQMAEILSGTAIGKILQDREAMMGFVGVSANKEGKAQMLGAIRNAQGTTDAAFTVMRSTTAYKVQQAANEKDVALSATLDKIKAPLDATLENATAWAQNNPGMATATAGAATAASMGIAGSSAASFLRGGKGAAKAAEAAGGTASAAATGTAKGAGTAAETAVSAGRGAKALSVAGKVAKIGGPLALILAGIDAVSTESNDTLTRDQKNIAHAGTAGGLAGGLGGSAAGAALGTAILPVVGTAIGALFGGIAGAWGGTEMGDMLGKMFWNPDSAGGGKPGEGEPPLQAVAAQLADSLQRQPINASITLEVDGAVLARAVERIQGQQAARQ